jgi:hypothetical protein
MDAETQSSTRLVTAQRNKIKQSPKQSATMILAFSVWRVVVAIFLT